MIAFFLLGAAAGMLNVYRTVAGLGHQVGYKPTQPNDDKARGGNGKHTG